MKSNRYLIVDGYGGGMAEGRLAVPWKKPPFFHRGKVGGLEGTGTAVTLQYLYRNGTCMTPPRVQSFSMTRYPVGVGTCQKHVRNISALLYASSVLPCTYLLIINLGGINWHVTIGIWHLAAGSWQLFKHNLFSEMVTHCYTVVPLHGAHCRSYPTIHITQCVNQSPPRFY